MTANTRIQWLHKKISEMSFPNATRIAERFGISHRQAQRDVDFLRRHLGAPVAYSAENKGFYYTAPFSLPLLLVSANDDSYVSDVTSRSASELAADETLIQMQIPFTATVEIPDKLTAIELNQFIISNEGKSRYICEFHSVEAFLGALFATDADVRLLEPAWLREKALAAAERMIGNNRDISD